MWTSKLWHVALLSGVEEGLGLLSVLTPEVYVFCCTALLPRFLHRVGRGVEMSGGHLWWHWVLIKIIIMCDPPSPPIQQKYKHFIFKDQEQVLLFRERWYSMLKVLSWEGLTLLSLVHKNQVQLGQMAKTLGYGGQFFSQLILKDCSVYRMYWRNTC